MSKVKTAIVVVGLGLAVAMCIAHQATAQVQFQRHGTIDTRCTPGRCVTNYTRGAGQWVQPDARIIELPDYRDDPEALERDRKWVEFCQPRVVTKAPDWVGRYVYAHPGCENGRSE